MYRMLKAWYDWVGIVLGLIAMTIIIGLVAWLWHRQNSASRLPSPAEVESMMANSIWYSPERLPSRIVRDINLPKGGSRTLPAFPVSRKHIEKILNTLHPARAINFDKEPTVPWIGVATL